MKGRIEVLVDPHDFASRAPAECDLRNSHVGVGRELFRAFRGGVGRADQGASIFGG